MGLVGVLGGQFNEGAGLQHACFSCPFMHWAPSGLPLSLPFQPNLQASPSFGFSGVEERIWGGKGGVVAGNRGLEPGTGPHPEALCWGPANGALKRLSDLPGFPPFPSGSSTGRKAPLLGL